MSCSGERIWAELGPTRILLASWTEELSRSGVEFESIERSSAVREEVTLSVWKVDSEVRNVSTSIEIIVDEDQDEFSNAPVQPCLEPPCVPLAAGVFGVDRDKE